MRVATTPDTLSIKALTDAWINNSVRPNPEYQRGSTWRLRQQQLLVDSVFRGYPLPRFYFQQKSTVDVLGNSQTSLEVIDGQQRLIALSQFREDKWPLFAMSDVKVALPKSIKRAEARWAGKTFSGLSADLQELFLEQALSVVLIDEAATDEVRDLFIRLQAGTPLTPQQVRDAWPGSVGPYVERLAGKGDRQGQFQTLFRAIDRRGRGGRAEEEYEDPALDARQSCAQLLTMFLGMERGRGFQTLTSAALNDLYHENTDFDATGQQARTFENLLKYLEVVVAARPDNVGRKVIRKSRIFSLFLFMRLLDNSSVALARNLAEVARHFWSDAAEVEEPGGRVGSAAALEEHLVWFTSKHMLDMRLPDLDHNRLFSSEQKTQIWSRSGGLCGICGKPASEQYVEYDQIKPWVLGGRTEVDNGRPVHPPCHARGLAALAQNPSG